MKKQRNTAQMKNARQKLTRPNKQEISNLPEREFRIMIVKMLERFENIMEKMQETFNIVKYNPQGHRGNKE